MKSIIVYSLKEYFKRKLFLITLVIGALLQIFVLYTQKYISGEGSFLDQKNQWNWLFNLPVYITTSFLVLLAAYHTFRFYSSTEEQFTRTMPISRKEIFAYRLMSISIFILLVSFFWFTYSSLLSLIDNKASAILRIKYSSSIFVGTIILSVFLVSLFLMLSLIFSGRIMLAISAVVITALPLFTIINHAGYKDKSSFEPQERFSTFNSNASVNKMYLLDNRKNNVTEKKLYEEYDPKLFNALNKIDIFNLFSNTLSMFNSTENNTWYDTGNTKLDSPYKIKINGNDYSVALSDKNIYNLPADNENRFNALKNDKNIILAIKANSDFNSLTLEQVVYFVQDLLTKATLSEEATKKVNDSINEAKTAGENDLKIIFSKSITWPIIKTIEHFRTSNINITDKSTLDIVNYISNDATTSIKLTNSDISIYRTHKQIDYQTFYIAVLFISISLISIYGYIYIKKKKQY